MKKLVSLLFLSVFILNFGQNQRFSYEYRYAIDSLKKDSIQTELMLLDVTDNSSVYYSKAKHDSDSLMQAELAKQMKTGAGSFSVSSTYRGSISYSVEKSIPDFKVYLITRLGEQYKVLDDRPMTWKILPETQKIGEWNVQKAETTFAGRRWVAWFTNEIPIPDGPYKFHGLPGLIVKVTTADGTHAMELKGVQKLNPAAKEARAESLPSNVRIIESKAIEISQKQYAKQFEKYKKDPNARVRQMLTSGKNVSINFNGKKMNSAELLRELDQKNKENRAKNRLNNPLELDVEK